MRAVRKFIIIFASSVVCWVGRPAPAFQGDTRPNYSAASIANAATNTLGPFAPNTIVTIYGSHLAFDTTPVSAQTISSDTLPTELGGVHVVIDGIPAGLYYVSPVQINFLIPNSLLPGDSLLVVARDGVSGPYVTMTLGEVAPGLFANPDSLIAATHVDGSVVTAENPALAGSWVVLYCVGMGRTAPDLYNGEVAVRAMPAVHWADLVVMVDATAVPASRVYYAGVTPGYAGLYQINVRLPDDMGANPEVRFGVGGWVSPPATHLAGR